MQKMGRYDVGVAPSLSERNWSTSVHNLRDVRQADNIPGDALVSEVIGHQHA